MVQTIKAVSDMKRLDNEESRRINYDADISELEKVYNRQFELIKKGNTDLVTLELVMLGRALDFVSFASKKLGVSLGTDEVSVKRFEEVLDAMQRGIVQDNFFSGEGGGISGCVSAYLGILIIARIGGKWEDTENGRSVNVNGRYAYVDEFIERRLLGLSELSAVDYFNSVSIVK